MNRRVVITGLGVITPNGIGKGEFWKTITEGRSAIKKITRFDISRFRSQIGGEISNFDPEKFMKPQLVKRTDRFAQFAIAATQLALEDAGLTRKEVTKLNPGIIIGTAVGGFGFAEEQYEIFRQKGLRRINPFLAGAVFPTAASVQVAITFKLHGPCYTVCAGCASGALAIANAFQMIRNGQVDMMITGGVDAPLTPLVFGSFDILSSISERNDEPEKAMRPFDKKRDGTVISEGAGIVVLEERQEAIQRGAHIYAEIYGTGITNDGYHITRPSLSGKYAIAAIRRALEDSYIEPEEVDYINAHGSSTPYNDSIETYAIKQIFGSRAYQIPISSIKSVIGHTQGAGGAIEAVACCLTLQRNILPPTINYEFPDPECDLDYVPNKAREKEVNVAMSNSFGFGGSNVILVFKKYTTGK